MQRYSVNNFWLDLTIKTFMRINYKQRFRHLLIHYLNFSSKFYVHSKTVVKCWLVGGAWLCGCYHDTQMTITLKPHSTLITLSDTFLALNKHWVFFIQDSFFLPAISIQLIQCHLMMEYGMSSYSIFRCESISLTDLVPSALHLHSFSKPRILDFVDICIVHGTNFTIYKYIHCAHKIWNYDLKSTHYTS